MATVPSTLSDPPVDVELEERHGVQAFDTGLKLLSAFVGAEPMPMLKTLSERTGMHPAKVHRYLVSLRRAGYVEQDAASGRYRLGPASLRLGFKAIASVDVLRVAHPLLPGFCRSVGATVLLAIWGDAGATVAMREALPGPIIITAAVGTALPLLRSSTGLTFGAFLPRSATASILKRELSQLRANPQEGVCTTPADVDQLFAEIRKRGLARVTGQLSAAVHALSAPVFDSAGDIVGVLSAVGAAGQFDSTWQGGTARALLAAAAELSRALGHGARPPRD